MEEYVKIRNKDRRCLVEYCKRVVESRGLCKNHFRRIRLEIKAGNYTEEELVQKGKLLPGKRDKFTKWLRGDYEKHSTVESTGRNRNHDSNQGVKENR